jgi:hypothetical protein
MFGDVLQIIKNLFTSKKKKLILDIKKKHKKNISDYDIYDYRRKHIKQTDSISNNDILMLILLEDVKSTEDKSAHSVSSNFSDFYTNKNTYEPTPNYSSQQVTTSPRGSKSTRDDDNYIRSSDYNSGEYSSGGSSSSSSDCSSSSSCD